MYSKSYDATSSLSAALYSISPFSISSGDILPSDVIQALQTLAPHNGGISALSEELLQVGLSLKRGDVIEQQSLPIIQEIIDSALNKAQPQLSLIFREELHRQG